MTVDRYADLLKMAESIREIQSALNAAEYAPILAHSWLQYGRKRGAWGHMHDAMIQVIAEMNTGHNPEDIVNGVYENSESIEYNIDYLNNHA